MYQLIHSQSKGFKLPGWEEERLKKFAQLEKLYEGMTEEELLKSDLFFRKSDSSVRKSRCKNGYPSR